MSNNAPSVALRRLTPLLLLLLLLARPGAAPWAPEPLDSNVLRRHLRPFELCALRHNQTPLDAMASVTMRFFF